MRMRSGRTQTTSLRRFSRAGNRFCCIDGELRFSRLSVMFRFASWRTAASPGLGRRSQQVGIAVFAHRNCCSGVLEPGRRTAASPASPACQALQGENCLFNLLSFESQLGKHFVDVQNEILLAPTYVEVLCMLRTPFKTDDAHDSEEV